MSNAADVAEVQPVLELTLNPASLRCAGTLDARTRRYVLEAVEVLLQPKPSSVCIDVSDLHVVDVDGADALAQAQRMARDADVVLRWQGTAMSHLPGRAPRRAERLGRRPVPGTHARVVIPATPDGRPPHPAPLTPMVRTSGTPAGPPPRARGPGSD